ncbi:Cleft lip and palate transmembrane protein 1-like protein [Armadillidium nasatum]|uniref:Cleft lip and palate transmembrane protein 1-like protein n=1 Tax=Armadillidium nasatum TaxID=96803 RepID=A0A5N5TBI6_9CRUS|nr:Cleft lip and palate transmembrane protein 1-like protein [Armadillidium nasatum]
MFFFRALMIYFITSFFRKSSDTPATSSPNNSGIVGTRLPATNLFSDGMLIDLYVYLSESENSVNFSDSSSLAWYKENLKYGDWTSGDNSDGIFTHSISFPASEHLRNNGSIYIHVYVVKSGYNPDPNNKNKMFSKKYTASTSAQLNKYRKKRYKRTSNLLTGHTELTEEEIMKAETMKVETISYWHPNLTINIIHDFTQWTRGSVPPPVDEYVEFTAAGDGYKPILFLNTYWNLNREYVPVNESTQMLNLSLTFQPLTLFRWQMYAAQSMKQKWAGAGILDQLNRGDEDDEDQDTMKEMFLETSPYLLGLTAVVTILHSVFEMLAFKNDVQFWNNRKSLEGLSVRSVFFNVFQSLIVLLYVLDNETNFVIKLSCFVGLIIELWKITKVMDVSINYEKRILGIPLLTFKDRGTYVHSNTRVYDEMAFKYLGMAFFPLLGGYCIYSLFYHEHKGWYSFVLSMLYGFLLTFGFIMMTPQLFINYKLKSVAHLPWRMLTYKALNTFIDDIFAFIIKMPTMYRLGCLRDDVIFFIFLYQRYIYPIDPSRLNEFGFSKDLEEEAKVKKEGSSSTNPSNSLEQKKNQ